MARLRQPRVSRTDPERDERVTLPLDPEDAIRALLATPPPEEHANGNGRKKPATRTRK